MTKGKSTDKGADNSPSRFIDARIKELGDWRGETLALVRNDWAAIGCGSG